MYTDGTWTKLVTLIGPWPNLLCHFSVLFSPWQVYPQITKKIPIRHVSIDPRIAYQPTSDQGPINVTIWVFHHLITWSPSVQAKGDPPPPHCTSKGCFPTVQAKDVSPLYKQRVFPLCTNKGCFPTTNKAWPPPPPPPPLYKQRVFPLCTKKGWSPTVQRKGDPPLYKERVIPHCTKKGWSPTVRRKGDPPMYKERVTPPPPLYNEMVIPHCTKKKLSELITYSVFHTKHTKAQEEICFIVRREVFGYPSEQTTDAHLPIPPPSATRTPTTSPTVVTSPQSSAHSHQWSHNHSDHSTPPPPPHLHRYASSQPSTRTSLRLRNRNRAHSQSWWAAHLIKISSWSYTTISEVTICTKPNCRLS